MLNEGMLIQWLDDFLPKDDSLDFFNLTQGIYFSRYLALARQISQTPVPPLEGASANEIVNYYWCWSMFKSISRRTELAIHHLYIFTSPDPTCFIDESAKEWLEETEHIDIDISKLNECVSTSNTNGFEAITAINDIIQHMKHKSNEALSNMPIEVLEKTIEIGYADFIKKSYHDLKIILKKDAGRMKERANERLNGEHWAKLVDADRELVGKATKQELTEDKQQVFYSDEYCRQMEQYPALINLVNDQFDTEDLFDFHHAFRIQHLTEKITPYNLDFFYNRVLRSDIIKSEMFPDLKEKLFYTPQAPAEDIISSPAPTPPTAEERTRQAVHDALRIMAGKMQTDELDDLPKSALWQGIYRVLADRGIVKAKDYVGFGRYINTLEVEGMTLADEGKSISKTDDGVLKKSLAEWNPANYEGRESTFKRFLLAATTFDKALTECMQQLTPHTEMSR